MGDIERRPEGEPSDQPEREQLPDYEIDLTGVVNQTESLIDVIHDAITEAGDEGEVPEWGARTIARYLADRMPNVTSGLHHFAAVGSADYRLLYNELVALHEAPGRDDFTAMIIDRLGTFLVRRQNRPSPERRPRHSLQMQALIDEHGAAFEAFLRLPDVSPDDAEAARSAFLESRAGSYATLEDLIADVVESLELERQLRESEVEHFASIDPRKVLELARETFDITSLDGTYHCFWK